MASIRSLPVELLLKIFEILAVHWIEERRDYTRDRHLPSVWLTTRSNSQILTCSLVCKQWSELSLPYVDWLLRLSTANMDGILSFIRQSPTRRANIKHLFVNFPKSSQESEDVNWAALWDVFSEVLKSVGDQLQTMDVMLWWMKRPAPEARIRLPSNLSHLWVRTSSGMTDPVLQNWFTGLEECKYLRYLHLRDIYTSLSSPAPFALYELIISAILPPDPAFFSASARTLKSLTAFRSASFDGETYLQFWRAFFPLLHLVKDTLEELDMDGRSEDAWLRHVGEDQLVAPILPRLMTLKLSTDFLGNLVDSFPDLRLSSRLVRLKLKNVPITSTTQDTQVRAREFQCNLQHLQRLTIRGSTEDLSIGMAQLVFDPTLRPQRLMRLDTNVTTFKSSEELKSFLQMTQPRMLDISVEKCFEVLDFLLTSGHTIPDIQEMSIAGRFSSSYFSSSSFTKGSCAAKRLNFGFCISSSFDSQGFEPLTAYLSGAAWTDQLETLTFENLASQRPTVQLDSRPWSDHKTLTERLGSRFELKGLGFCSYEEVMKEAVRRTVENDVSL
ncbi:hypothetical protein BT69DRAFT_1318282 [Atractiella rhizophila]|nr:hypothetical protein BT69DRAFT_1318282 [Atractiella rhizophila]